MQKYINETLQKLTNQETTLVLTHEDVRSVDKPLSVFVYQVMMSNVSFLEGISSISQISGLVDSDRRNETEIYVTEKCKIVFADCSPLLIEGSDNNVECQVESPCSETKTLQRIRKWCQPCLE